MFSGSFLIKLPDLTLRWGEMKMLSYGDNYFKWGLNYSLQLLTDTETEHAAVNVPLELSVTSLIFGVKWVFNIVCWPLFKSWNHSKWEGRCFIDPYPFTTQLKWWPEGWMKLKGAWASKRHLKQRINCTIQFNFNYRFRSPLTALLVIKSSSIGAHQLEKECQLYPNLLHR